MVGTSTEIERTWSHATAEVPERGLERERTATVTERDELARVLEILGIERLDVRYRIAPLSGGRFRLTGTIKAVVVQSCIVTLDPVATGLDEEVDVEFRPREDIPSGPGSVEQEQSALEADEHEPIEHNRLAVGRIVVETLAAALPPYPRAADAALEQTEAGPAGGGAGGPFAGLAGWKPKQE